MSKVIYCPICAKSIFQLSLAFPLHAALLDIDSIMSYNFSSSSLFIRPFHLSSMYASNLYNYVCKLLAHVCKLISYFYV
jgi:hypothetical protein